jgi:hexosaminidase
MSPVNPLTYRYLQEVIDDELAAVPHPQFFHIGSDEPIDLGRGQSKATVESEGDAAVYAAHVSRVASLVQGSRVMIWDDAIQRQPQILDHIPKNAVIVNWKYGAERTFVPYIQTIASRGFDQMVAPGANNWTEVFPDLPTALPNEERFVNEGKSAHVLGLFQTVWHDDGETLYEATWFPVLYAAALAWHGSDVTPKQFADDFPWAFFGSTDRRYSTDIETLGNLVHTLGDAGGGSTDVLFWTDPFESRVANRLSDAMLSTVRMRAEGVLRHLTAAHPPLHANAARVMALAARRLDYLARDFQIGRETRFYYDDARANATKLGIAVRSLFVSKYLMWELRDNMEEIAPLYAAAWDYENRAGHRASALERYHVAAQLAIVRADRIALMTSEDFLKNHRFPTLDETLGLQPAP